MKLNRKSWYSASFPSNDGGLPRPLMTLDKLKKKQRTAGKTAAGKRRCQSTDVNVMYICHMLKLKELTEWIKRCREDCLSSLVILFSSPNFTTPQNGLRIPRNSSVKDVLLPAVWNKRVTHQFWPYWNTTKVSLNCSKIAQGILVIQAVFEFFSYCCLHESSTTEILRRNLVRLLVQTLLTVLA